MAASVRYIVLDVDEAIRFYTELLGFKVEMHPAPAFAILSLGDLRLMLSKPGEGGGGQAVSGQTPAPGGWNRFQIEVSDIEGVIDRLKAAGAQFRGEMITGIGAKQILVEDPSGNAVEIFEQLPR